MANHKTVYEDCDILIVGGGMAGTGATFESRYWGRDMNIVCVEKSLKNGTKIYSPPSLMSRDY